MLVPVAALPDSTTLRTRLGGAEITTSDEAITLRLKLETGRRSGGMAVFHPAGTAPVQRPGQDPTLVSALIRAEAWKRRLLGGQTTSIETTLPGPKG